MIAADVVEVEGVGVVRGQVLEVNGEADVERIAAAVDHARSRKDDGDEPEMQEVGGHLVGGAPDAVGGAARERREIGLGERAHVVAAEVRHRLEVSERPTLAACLAACLAAWARDSHAVKEAQLARAVHLGVAREDLLDQRGARAQHADDEHRQLARAAEGRLLGHALAREELDSAADGRRVRLGVEGPGCAADGVGLGEAGEGALGVAAVVVDLGEREAERRARGADQGRVLEHRLDARDLGRVLGPEALGPRQMLAGHGEIRAKLERAAKTADGARDVTARDQALAEKREGLGVLGVELERTLDGGDGAVDVALRAQRPAEVRERPGARRLELERAAVRGERLLEPALIAQRPRERIVQARLAGRRGERSAEHRLGLARALRHRMRLGEPVRALAIAGLERERPLELGARFVDPPEGERRRAEPRAGDGVLAAGERRPVRIARLGVRAERAQGFSQRNPRLRALGVIGAGATKVLEPRLDLAALDQGHPERDARRAESGRSRKRAAIGLDRLRWPARRPQRVPRAKRRLRALGGQGRLAASTGLQSLDWLHTIYKDRDS